MFFLAIVVEYLFWLVFGVVLFVLVFEYIDVLVGISVQIQESRFLKKRWM
jgi:hypothetical protein